MEDTATDDSRQKLLNEESQESTTDQSQVEVVNQEETLELHPSQKSKLLEAFDS